MLWLRQYDISPNTINSKVFQYEIPDLYLIIGVQRRLKGKACQIVEVAVFCCVVVSYDLLIFDDADCMLSEFEKA